MVRVFWVYEHRASFKGVSCIRACCSVSVPGEHNDEYHQAHAFVLTSPPRYSPNTTAASSAAVTADRDQVTLDEIRQLTHLPEYPIEQVFETFAEATDEEGLLQR